MTRWIGLTLGLLIACCLWADERTWLVGDPVFEAGPTGSFCEVSVKDPTIVFFEGRWRLFFTASSEEAYGSGYVEATTLDALNEAPRHELPMIRGKTRYGCAPQVFYFESQETWYLIFQTRDANYQPAYSTTRTIGDPTSWSAPQPLIEKDAREKRSKASKSFAS